MAANIAAFIKGCVYKSTQLQKCMIIFQAISKTHQHLRMSRLVTTAVS